MVNSFNKKIIDFFVALISRIKYLLRADRGDEIEYQ